jgi:hypothetical protein
MWAYNCIGMNDKTMQNHWDWLWGKNVPEGHLHVVILWNMDIDRCGHIVAFEWMIKGCNSPRLKVAQRYTWRTSSCRHSLKMDIDRWGHIVAFEWMTKGCNSPRLTMKQRCTWRTSSCRHHLKYQYQPMWTYNCNYMNTEKMHTTRTDGGTKMYVKDIFISSYFETWLLTDEDTRLNKSEWWKEAHL